jgi:hypothetical protein
MEEESIRGFDERARRMKRKCKWWGYYNKKFWKN